MVKSYLLIAIRSLIRSKASFIMNVGSMAMAIAVAAVILKFVAFELGYDDFHTRKNDTYRLRHDFYQQHGFVASAVSYYEAGPTIKQSFPEVEQYVRVHRADGMITTDAVGAQRRTFYESKSYYVDANFFSVFNFHLKKGSVKKCLKEPNSVVISKSIARKYFGENDPMGQVLKLTTEWQGGEYVVRGVFDDVPANSHFSFQLLFTIEPLLHNSQFKYGGWYWANFYTYLVLHPGTDVSVLEKKITRLINERVEHEVLQSQSHDRFALQPLTEIHLHSNLNEEFKKNGSISNVSILAFCSIFILIIGWFNYAGLSRIKVDDRLKEVSIRKMSGASKRNIFMQFVIENMFATIVTLTLATFLFVGIVWLSSAAWKLSHWHLLRTWDPIWSCGVIVIIIGTFLATNYSSLALLTSYGRNLKNSGVSLYPQRGNSRQLLVSIQFAACLFQIIVAITIYEQSRLISKKDPKLDIANKLVVKAPRTIPNSSYSNAIDVFRNEIGKNTWVETVTASSEVPGCEIFWTNEFWLSGTQNKNTLNVIATDAYYLSAFKVRLLAGRNFENGRIADFGESVLINESAMKLLGIALPENALGAKLMISPTSFKVIVGVVADFYHETVLKPNSPIVFYNIPWTMNYITIAMDSVDKTQALSVVRNKYATLFPENGFDYFFIDDKYLEQYKPVEELASLCITFAVLVAILSSVGLLALCSVVVRTRVKEFAIRKVVGSSSQQIIFLLLRQLSKPVFAGFVIAVPISIIVIEDWLNNYPVRTNLTVTNYAAGIVLTLLASLTPLIFQISSAARQNPIEALKTD